MASGSFDPKFTAITFNGVFITGFAEGDFLDIDQEEDDVSLAVGADGEVAFAQSNNDSAKATLKLLQTANSNTYLTEQRNIQKLSRSSRGGVLFIEDLNSGTTAISQNARILRTPKQTYGTEIKEREWVFLCGSMTISIKGNAF